MFDDLGTEQILLLHILPWNGYQIGCDFKVVELGSSQSDALSYIYGK
jgi:hypothetical protein